MVVSARSIRRDVLATAPRRLGPEVTKSPVLLLDGTGERAGPTKGGVALHLAIGLVARSRQGRRVRVEAVLLGATVGEGWDVMAGLLAGVKPGLIVVDGEAELSALAAEVFPGVAVQRCLWHLARGLYRAARYNDCAVSESWFATFKNELISTRSWPTLAGLRPAVFEYIEGWYNTRRLHSSLGYRSPAHYEATIHQETAARAA